MSLVTAQNLTLCFGERIILDAASFTIGPRERIGLVGPNGTGKSSLMKILAGQQNPDEGTVKFSRRAVAGYLPQDIAALPPLPLVDAVLSSVPGRTELEERLRAAEAALATLGERVGGEAAVDERASGTSTEDLLLELSQELADLHEELEHFEEHYGRPRAEEILGGLGFKPEDLQRPTSELSGGWKMRAALAGLLLQEPDLLLLDEPTNHLDVPTLEWFDEFLLRSQKALMLVCHDREFLDKQIGRVLSFEMEGLRSYTGNYESYKSQRAVEVVQLESAAARQKARRAQLQEFIDRFGAKNTKASAAQSKRKMLEKMEIILVREERAHVRFRFPEAARSGKEVLRIQGMRKNFGARVVYDGVDAEIQRGHRVGVIGVNGAGKTTLLRLIAGELAPDTGTIALGHSVQLGYYAQHHTDKLDPKHTILDEVGALVPDKPPSYVRGVLGAFLFQGDDVDKRIGVLSGGERARVALAKLLLVPANFLVMDEPTNHLDLDSSETLIEALREHTGTLLFVSHNKSFVNQLATHVWDVKAGRLEAWPGNLDDYRYHLAMSDPARTLPTQRAGPGRGPGTPGTHGTQGTPPGTSGASDAASAEESARDRRRREAQAREKRGVLEKPIKKEIADLEERIGALEMEMKAAESALADPALYNDFVRARPHMEQYRAAKAKLDELYGRWEHQQELLAALPQE